MASRVSGPPRRPGGPGYRRQGRRATGAARPPRAPAAQVARPVALARPGQLCPGRTGRRCFFAGTAVVIVGVMAWALLGSSLLVVRSVQVAGNGKAVSAGQVLAAARVTNGQPLIWVDAGAISRRVEQLRQVQSAQVSKDWPTTLVITVQLRRPVFALPLHGSYALVDPFGVSVRDVAHPCRPPGHARAVREHHQQEPAREPGVARRRGGTGRTAAAGREAGARGDHRRAE